MYTSLYIVSNFVYIKLYINLPLKSHILTSKAHASADQTKYPEASNITTIKIHR